MKFRKQSSITAISDCGQYEMRVSRMGDAKQTSYYNVWHLPTGKHVGAGFRQSEVRAECERHRDAITTGNTTGATSSAAEVSESQVSGQSRCA